MRFLIPQLTRKRTGYNFRARPLPIFVIFSNWGTYVISPNPEKVNLLAHARACINFLALPGVHRLEFSRVIGYVLRHLAKLGYLCNFTQFLKGQYFSTRVHVRNFPDPLGCAPVTIFTRDRFQNSSFSPNGVPVRFRPIPRRSIF